MLSSLHGSLSIPWEEAFAHGGALQWDHQHCSGATGTAVGPPDTAAGLLGTAVGGPGWPGGCPHLLLVQCAMQCHAEGCCCLTIAMALTTGCQAEDGAFLSPVQEFPTRKEKGSTGWVEICWWRSGIWKVESSRGQL